MSELSVSGLLRGLVGFCSKNREDNAVCLLDEKAKKELLNVLESDIGT